MQMLNQDKTNNKKRNVFRKSQLLLLGSFLVFIGIFILSYNHLVFLKNQVFSNMEISILGLDLPVDDDETEQKDEEKVEIETPVADNVSDGTTYEESTNQIDYSKYVGVLEIPKIGLKRGFYDTNSKYNSIEYNVSVVLGSTMPDIVNGNLMLMAHSGDAYISFFAYLYQLNIGDLVYVTYQGKKYEYRMVNIYTVPKTGKVAIYRNYNKTTLTLITCTKNDDTTQTIYIAELV